MNFVFHSFFYSDEYFYRYSDSENPAEYNNAAYEGFVFENCKSVILENIKIIPIVP